MSMSNDPTHPKVTEDIDDVEAHGFRRSALRDDPQPQAEALEKVGGPKERSLEDDVDGHAYRRMAVPDEDVEAHAFRRMAVPDDDVDGHAYRRTALPDDAQPQPEDLARVKQTAERADDDVEGHATRGRA